MVLESKVKELFLQLLKERGGELSFMGSTISIQLEEEGSRVLFSAPVYWGGNYIPPSVRACLRQRGPEGTQFIEVFPEVNEEQFEIILNHRESLQDREPEHFALVLEEFAEAANEWKEWLDQHDKNDLVYVRPPST